MGAGRRGRRIPRGRRKMQGRFEARGVRWGGRRTLISFTKRTGSPAWRWRSTRKRVTERGTCRVEGVGAWVLWVE